ncbi:hypothetical protein PAHAL_1G333100 [Panicum hallii]|uniref:DUF4408 domain-containing protein n=1 Tax=Panicum hallii TaxID=206008 RepID=A0A2S3GS34_9POAL|nr:uncharacterized protein LOC112873419 [Panicum hallii]PAN07405.1 hypothetical protein PAHAL_1G333100 [Panicum hallii]
MAGATPSPTQTSHVSGRAMAIPAGLVPAAVLLAAAVGLLALLPSLAQAVWEVPHLALLGLVISYGVFTQRNADAGGDGSAAKEGSLAWNARYHPDGPLVVVADHAAPSGGGGGGQRGARERPLSLPVRRLKTAPSSAKQSETDGDAGDAFGEETDSCASSSGFWAGARAVPSPPSVLDADMGLSPCSQPQSPRPFFIHSANTSHGLNAATPSTMSRGFAPGYRPSVPHDQPCSDDGEGSDWDDEDADGSDEMTVSSERSVRGDFAAACANDHSEGDTSVDEELLELAAKAGPDGEEEVDRKADEFIAKFREQIRLQRH